MSEQRSRLRITWVKSGIGYAGDQKRTVAALGLRRLHQVVEHEDSPSVRGMVAKVRHLVTSEVLSAPAGEQPAGRRAAKREG